MESQFLEIIHQIVTFVDYGTNYSFHKMKTDIFPLL